MEYKSNQKELKVMNQGWRGDAFTKRRLDHLIDEVKSGCGDSFVKTEFMDFLINLAIDTYEAGENKSESKPEEVEPKKAPVKRFNFKQALIDEGVNPDHATLWMDVRKAKKAVNSIEAFIQFKGNLGTYALPQAVEVCANEQWKGFKVSWMENLEPEKKKRYSFMDLAAGQHLESMPNQTALSAPSYIDEFAALEHQHSEGE